VPIGGGEAQMLAHALSLDEFVRIIMLESKRIFGAGALVSAVGQANEVFFFVFHKMR